ncbi:MAG: sensor domain-containing diguanylate cyclase [Candidatus Omnitrophota bacterium]
MAAVLFIGLLYFLVNGVPALKSSVEHLGFIVISLLIAMSLVIMLFWASLGVLGGMGSFLIAMIFLYKPLTDLNPYYYSVLILAFFLNSFAGYYISRKISVSNQDYTVTMEKIHEDTNLISNHHRNREAEVEAMGKKVDSLLYIKDIADSLSISLSEDEVVRIVGDKTLELFGEGKRVLLYMLDEPHKELNLAFSAKDRNRQAVSMKKGGIFDRWVLKNVKSLLVKDVRKDYRFSVDDEESKEDFISLISKPLIIEGNVLGILRVDSTRESAFGQHELRLLDIIGQLTAVAIENARLYKQTEELAIKDGLTGLYVRRHFMERLEEEVKRALRSDRSFALLMIDIDNFKSFNDEHGHISGDEALRNIGKIMVNKMSAGDMVGRYGGEEFVFLALNHDRKTAVKFADEIRKEIMNTPIILRREKRFVTVSIGVAVFPQDARLREDIIWEADRCLYEAKSKGKNIVCAK